MKTLTAKGVKKITGLEKTQSHPTSLDNLKLKVLFYIMCCFKYHTKPFILDFEILKYLIPFDGLRIILPDTLTDLQLNLELPQGNFSFFFFPLK